MIAYKFLARGSVGPFSGFSWPTGAPGPWVEARSSRAHACFDGIHGCTAEHLPFWLHDELWEVELDGPIGGEHKLVAPRGRLLRRLEAWDGDAGRDFALDCLSRVRALAETEPPGLEELATAIAGDVARFAEAGRPATAGFAAARIAELAGGADAYDRERTAQAAWLAGRLSLAATR